jgi:shikimate dehydrogenase
VPASLLRRGGIVFDMVYDPIETRLLREAQQAGCQIIGGLEMLLAQAAAQFEAWTGQEAPLDAMKGAALFLAQKEEA